MGAFSYNIDQALGILSQSEDGKYTTEVNMISYNGNVRSWIYEGGTGKRARCSKEWRWTGKKRRNWWRYCRN